MGASCCKNSYENVNVTLDIKAQKPKDNYESPNRESNSNARDTSTKLCITTNNDETPFAKSGARITENDENANLESTQRDDKEVLKSIAEQTEDEINLAKGFNKSLGDQLDKVDITQSNGNFYINN